MKKKIVLTALTALAFSWGTATVGHTEECACTHEVVKGDTLWHISDSFLADPLLWSKIWKNNTFIKNPDLIYPRQIVAIPGRSCACPEEYACIHEVVRGDTLWHISGRYLGEPTLWPRLWHQNPEIENPHLIFPEQRLRVPCEEKSAMVEEPAAPAPPETSSRVTMLPESSAPAMPDLGELSGPAGGPNPVLANTGNTTLARAQAVPEGIGTLVKKPEFSGRVIGQTEGWSMTGDNEMVLVDIPGAEKGQRYGIYRDLGVIRHPDNYLRNLGHMVVEVGVLEIVSTESRSQTAHIVSAYQEVCRNDAIGPVPQQQVVPLDKESRMARGLTGTVVAIHNLSEIATGNDLVYVDLGGQDGVEPGDLLYLSKAMSPESAVRVVTVTENTATAMVLPTTARFVAAGDTLAAIP